MNKRQLKEKLAIAFGTTKENADNMLKTFVGVIEESLISGQDVSIPWFGKFSIAKRAEKNGYNPHTKESMTIPAYSTPVFKPWIGFKDKIKNKFPN